MLVMVAGVLFMLSCQQGGKGYDKSKNDSIRDRRVDSLIGTAKQTRNVDSVYMVVDSLEKLKEIGPIRASTGRRRWLWR